MQGHSHEEQHRREERGDHVQSDEDQVPHLTLLVELVPARTSPRRDGTPEGRCGEPDGMASGYECVLRRHHRDRCVFGPAADI
jgi:hypothetical protein